MGFVGRKPTNAPLVSSDLGTGIVGSTNIADGTITLDDLSATGTKDATTFLRGDNTFATPAGGTNTPAFEATIGTQSIANNTATVMQYNTENFDTDSCYDTTTYKFTPNVAGKYFVYAKFRFDTGTDFDTPEIFIEKNSTKFAETTWRAEYYESPLVVGFTTLNGTTDFVIVKGFQNSGSPLNANTGVFGAYRIIE